MTSFLRSDFSAFNCTSFPSAFSFCCCQRSHSSLSLASCSSMSFVCFNASSCTRSLALVASRAASASCVALFLVCSIMSFSCSSFSVICFRCKIVDKDLAFISSFSVLCFNSLAFVLIRASLSFSALSCLPLAPSLLRIAADNSLRTFRNSLSTSLSPVEINLPFDNDDEEEEEVPPPGVEAPSFDTPADARAADLFATRAAFFDFSSSSFN
mmetsp:Transcript_19322/g.26802  ORF Transcript_19322/g.26802 Transcript_19322/m.26802 type:complete len:212 (-) Transcript_19322:904-1539(-)